MSAAVVRVGLAAACAVIASNNARSVAVAEKDAVVATDSTAARRSAKKEAYDMTPAWHSACAKGSRRARRSCRGGGGAAAADGESARRVAAFAPAPAKVSASRRAAAAVDANASANDAAARAVAGASSYPGTAPRASPPQRPRVSTCLDRRPVAPASSRREAAPGAAPRASVRARDRRAAPPRGRTTRPEVSPATRRTRRLRRAPRRRLARSIDDATFRLRRAANEQTPRRSPPRDAASATSLATPSIHSRNARDASSDVTGTRDAGASVQSRVARRVSSAAIRPP